MVKRDKTQFKNIDYAFNLFKKMNNEMSMFTHFYEVYICFDTINTECD